MAYDVTIERTTECPTAVVKANTAWRVFPTLWPTLLDEVWAFLGARPGLRTEGHNIMLYRNDVPKSRSPWRLASRWPGPSRQQAG
jgi:hypothetical protein